MKFITFIFAVLIVFFGYGFKNIGNDESGKQQNKISGKELFQLNCAVCHGIDRQGKPPAFPSLVSVGERLTRDQVLALLQKGRKVMPSFKSLSGTDKSDIYAWLQTMEGMYNETVTSEAMGCRMKCGKW